MPWDRARKLLCHLAPHPSVPLVFEELRGKPRVSISAVNRNRWLSPEESCLRSKSGSILQKGERKFHGNKTDIASDTKQMEAHLGDSETRVQTQF